MHCTVRPREPWHRVDDTCRDDLRSISFPGVENFSQHYVSVTVFFVKLTQPVYPMLARKDGDGQDVRQYSSTSDA